MLYSYQSLVYCDSFVKEQKRHLPFFLALLTSFYIFTPQKVPSERDPKGEEPLDPVWLLVGLYNVAQCRKDKDSGTKKT